MNKKLSVWTKNYPEIGEFTAPIQNKVLTPAVWESSIHMFDELGVAVYETIRRVAMEDEEQEAAPRDNGCVEAILDLRVI